MRRCASFELRRESPEEIIQGKFLEREEEEFDVENAGIEEEENEEGPQTLP